MWSWSRQLANLTTVSISVEYSLSTTHNASQLEFTVRPPPLEWFSFANGGATAPLRIGLLPVELARRLGSSTQSVYVHPSYAAKFVFKHKMRPEHFPPIELAIWFGTAAITSKQPRSISFFYNERVIFGRMFHVAIKTTGEQHELWVRTFHQITNADHNRRIRKSEILRHQES